MRVKRRTEVPVYPHDINVFEPVKFLNILVADMRCLSRDMYTSAGVRLMPDEPFTSLHLNPYSPPGELGIQAARRSLTMLADYVTLHPAEIPDQQIYGLTHPKLGRIATYFGFEYAPLEANQLPAGVVDCITSKQNGEVVLVHQNTSDLVGRFGSGDIHSPLGYQNATLL